MSAKAATELTWNDPAEVGWYATLHTWDPTEGLFPDAHYWDGSKWLTEHGRETNASVTHWPPLFNSYAEAEKYAGEHDPEV